MTMIRLIQMQNLLKWMRPPENHFHFLFHLLLYYHPHLQNYYHSFPVHNYWKSSIRNFFQSFYILVPLAIPSIKPYSAIRINSFNLAILSPPTTPDFNIIEFVAMAM